MSAKPRNTFKTRQVLTPNTEPKTPTRHEARWGLCYSRGIRVACYVGRLSLWSLFTALFYPVALDIDILAGLTVPLLISPLSVPPSLHKVPPLQSELFHVKQHFLSLSSLLFSPPYFYEHFDIFPLALNIQQALLRKFQTFKSIIELQ